MWSNALRRRPLSSTGWRTKWTYFEDQITNFDPHLIHRIFKLNWLFFVIVHSLDATICYKYLAVILATGSHMVIFFNKSIHQNIILSQLIPREEDMCITGEFPCQTIIFQAILMANYH